MDGSGGGAPDASTDARIDSGMIADAVNDAPAESGNDGAKASSDASADSAGADTASGGRDVAPADMAGADVTGADMGPSCLPDAGIDALPTAATGRDLYVAQMAAGASDGNDGLAATTGGGHGPWLTLGHAAGAAKAGDVVHVYDGNYGESVNLTTSGTMTAPIVFAAAAGQSPTSVSFSVRDAQWIDVAGFALVGPDAMPSTWQDMPAVVIDDPSVGWIDPRQALSVRDPLRWQKYKTYMSLEATTAYMGTLGEFSNYTNGLQTVGGSHVVFADNTISQHTTGIGLYADSAGTPSSFVTVVGNHAFHCRAGVWSFCGSCTTAATDLEITRNRFEQNLSSGVYLRNATRATIEGNTVEYNAITNMNVSFGTSDADVRGNVMAYAGYYSEAMDYPGSSSISLFTAGTGNIVESNHISYQYDPSGYDGNGVILDTATPTTIVRNNTIFRTQGSGVTNASSAGATVVNNSIAEPGYAIAMMGNGECFRTNNESSPNTVANNICYMPAVAGVGSWTPTLSTDALIDYDLYDLGTGIPVARDNGTPRATLAAFQTSDGWEKHGLVGDPGFVDEPNGDLRLTTGSPAIGAGDGGVAPPYDLTGRARATPPAIGAYEYVAPPSCP
jgi:hypothetical protein